MIRICFEKMGNEADDSQDGIDGQGHDLATNGHEPNAYAGQSNEDAW